MEVSMKKIILGAALLGVALAGALAADQAAAPAAAAVAPAAAAAVKAVPYPKDALIIDDFEGLGVSKLKTGWYAGCDTNNLGSKLEPQPFKVTDGGAPLTPGHCGRIFGHFGKNQAPWPYAQLSLDLKSPKAAMDISGYKAIAFWAKGDMKNYKVTLCRDAVTDYADFAAPFFAGKQWKQVVIAFTDFSQPSDWGKKVPAGWKDVNQVKWGPIYNDVDFDMSIDDIALLKEVPVKK
jgi:hypothetical protein